MKETYRSKYDVIYVDNNNKIVKNVWLKESVDMNSNEFKAELIELQKILVKNKTYGILGNTLDLNYAIVPGEQEWIAQNYFPEVIAAGLKKYAIIVSEDLITELSVEQTIDENVDAPFDTKYFSNEGEASKWLLER